MNIKNTIRTAKIATGSLVFGKSFLIKELASLSGIPEKLAQFLQMRFDEFQPKRKSTLSIDQVHELLKKKSLISTLT